MKRAIAWVCMLALLIGTSGASIAVYGHALPGATGPTATDNDLVFIHHSVGANWLSDGLHDALLAKDYIDERNDIYYGTDLPPDSGRPDSLGSVPGDQTDMDHWVRWFNDYLQGVRQYGAADGFNQIVMFKSCYPNSDVYDDGSEPGDPFDGSKTLANYKAVYRHPSGPGHTYSYGGHAYKPLEDVFAENPDVLFIAVTAPPLHYAPSDATTDANGHRARLFNNWLKNDWLASYNAAHPGLNNVAVFDLFGLLAYPDDHASHPNRLRSEYGGAGGDSHPNTTANVMLTQVFATDQDSFIDAAWDAFLGGGGCGDLSSSTKRVSSGPADPGDVVTYTVRIENAGCALSAVQVTDDLPTPLAFGQVWCSSGSCDQAGGAVTWSGAVGSSASVALTYTVQIDAHAAVPQVVVNTAQIDNGAGTTVQRQATLIVGGYEAFLPAVSQRSAP